MEDCLLVCISITMGYHFSRQAGDSFFMLSNESQVLEEDSFKRQCLLFFLLSISFVYFPF
jgi:hypothetical protein